MTETFLELERVWLNSASLVNVSAMGCDPGSSGLELEIDAFIGRDSRLNPDQCSRASRKCRIALRSEDDEVWAGAIVKCDEGWLIHRKAGDDDPAWWLDVQAVRPGGYLAIYQPGRVLRFQIVSVKAAVSRRAINATAPPR